ncbi:hypothetical protein L2E82_11583 [Cichorium intybus]|uniref:Uncharacterized protein n=1 Tax=Cichorium intybus TaxID=13427 RepID=A0ACB9GEC0_CICIN|nr:hypothetical protein L2E82_11583 [Cichorium intybus]
MVKGSSHAHIHRPQIGAVSTSTSGIEKLNQEIELTSKLSILSDILSNTCCALLIHSHTISFDPHLGNFDLVPKMKEITRLGKMKERTRTYSFRLDSRVVSERGLEKRLVNGDGGAADLCVGEVSSLSRLSYDEEIGDGEGERYVKSI